MDWKEKLALAWVIKQHIKSVDSEGLWELKPPRLAASEMELSVAERALGFQFDSEHRLLLQCANGWERFYQNFSIFGTNEYLNKELAAEVRGVIEEKVFATKISDYQTISDETYALAYSEHDAAAFLIGKPRTSLGGKVIWLSGTVVERFPSIGEWYATMLDYLRLEYTQLSGR